MGGRREDLVDLLLNYLARFPQVRGAAAVPEVLALADRRSGSPMETRLRLLLIHAGLPRLQVQWVVQDPVAREAVWLDLAYPEHLVGAEYDGAEHTRPERVLRDIRRGTRLVDQGWRLYRYTKREIYTEADTIIAEVRRALTRGAGADGRTRRHAAEKPAEPPPRRARPLRVV
jgi:very-short-patch-repair endonuclease